MTSQAAVAGAPVPGQHPCHIDSNFAGQVRVVRVTGRLDWVTAGELRDLLRDECSNPAVVVDLRATTGIDSAGVGILLAATARMRERGQQLAFVATEPFLVGVLCSTGLEMVVPIVDTETEALSRFDAAVRS